MFRTGRMLGTLGQLLALRGRQHRGHVQPGIHRTLRDLVHQLAALGAKGLEAGAVQRLGLIEGLGPLVQGAHLLMQRTQVLEGSAGQLADLLRLLGRALHGFDHLIDAVCQSALGPARMVLHLGLIALHLLRGIRCRQLPAFGLGRRRRAIVHRTHTEGPHTEQIQRGHRRGRHHARPAGAPHALVTMSLLARVGVAMRNRCTIADLAGLLGPGGDDDRRGGQVGRSSPCGGNSGHGQCGRNNQSPDLHVSCSCWG